jgi:hypothetical protein
MPLAAVHESGCGRFCCKSLFALVIKNSPGYRGALMSARWRPRVCAPGLARQPGRGRAGRALPRARHPALRFAARREPGQLLN